MITSPRPRIRFSPLHFGTQAGKISFATPLDGTNAEFLLPEDFADTPVRSQTPPGKFPNMRFRDWTLASLNEVRACVHPKWWEWAVLVFARAYPVWENEYRPDGMPAIKFEVPPEGDHDAKVFASLFIQEDFPTYGCPLPIENGTYSGSGLRSVLLNFPGTVMTCPVTDSRNPPMGAKWYPLRCAEFDWNARVFHLHQAILRGE